MGEAGAAGSISAIARSCGCKRGEGTARFPVSSRRGIGFDFFAIEFSSRKREREGMRWRSNESAGSLCRDEIIW